MCLLFVHSLSFASTRWHSQSPPHNDWVLVIVVYPSIQFQCTQKVWVFVNVLFHVLFTTRPPTVVSVVCQCVSTPKSPPNTELCSWFTIYPLHTLTITNNIMPFCMSHTPVHHVSSMTALRSSQCCLLCHHRSCGCSRMHHLFAPTINTLCVCHFGAIQYGPPPCFGALAVVPVVHEAIVLHKHMHHFWTVDVAVWHPRGFTQSTYPPLHQPLHIVVVIKTLPMMVSTSKSFGKSPVHTHGSNPSITIIRVPSNTSHHTTWLNGSAMLM